MQSAKAIPRVYVSPVRVAAAAGIRQDVIAAATRLLREKDGLASLSVEAVARHAGVTRLTVYNHFGSRRGLWEAVFDDIAARSDLARLGEAVGDPDPARSLALLVEIMCAVWGRDPAIGQLLEARALDREFARALLERNERRRSIIRSIVRRLHPDQPDGQARDRIDLLFALTAYATFHTLSPGRTPAEVRDLLTRACHAAACD